MAPEPDRSVVDGEPDRWEQHAAWWQEHFTEGADPEYEEQILPLAERWAGGPGRVLEVGTGEGQVARRLAATGATVVGLDLAAAQVAEAARRAGGPRYARASATALPVVGGAVDRVVACLVLEHLDDLEGAVAEVARVLRAGGRCCLFLNHPLLQTPGSGWIDDQVLDPPEQYWRVGPYLVEQATIETVQPGVHIRFVHRPLSRYLNALADAGLVLEHMAEPAPPPGFLVRAPEYPDAADIPRLLLLVLRRT